MLCLQPLNYLSIIFQLSSNLVLRLSSKIGRYKSGFQFLVNGFILVIWQSSNETTLSLLMIISDRNLNEFFTSDQSVMSVRVTQLTIKVLEAAYPEKTLMEWKFWKCPTVMTISNFSFPWPKFHCFDSIFLQSPSSNITEVWGWYKTRSVYWKFCFQRKL